MSRSLKKGLNVDERLEKKITQLAPNDKTVVKTWNRSAIITPRMVGRVIGVHNGKIHVPVLVVENMVGHRLGEFSPTRKFVRHGGKMQKDIEQSAAAANAPAPAAPAAQGKK